LGGLKAFKGHQLWRYSKKSSVKGLVDPDNSEKWGKWRNAGGVKGLGRKKLILRRGEVIEGKEKRKECGGRGRKVGLIGQDGLEGGIFPKKRSI